MLATCKHVYSVRHKQASPTQQLQAKIRVDPNRKDPHGPSAPNHEPGNSDLQAKCFQFMETSIVRQFNPPLTFRPLQSTTTTTPSQQAIDPHKSAQRSSHNHRIAHTNKKNNDAVKNNSHSVGPGGCSACLQRRHTAAAGEVFRNRPGWHPGPEAHVRRSQGPGPHLPEPLRQVSAGPQAREEDGRLAQDQGDNTQGPRLDHRRDQGFGSARTWRCRFPVGSEMGL